MLNEKKRMRRKRWKKFRVALISIIILYLTFRMLPILHASKVETHTVKNGELEVLLKVNGIVLKEETVYKSTATGEIIYLVDEGERIGVQDKVVEISLNNDIVQLKEELKEIEEELNQLEENNISKSVFKSDIDKNQRYIDSLIKEIQESILNKDYKKASEAKKKLEDSLDKHKNLTGQNGYNASNIERLKQRREEILAKIQVSNIEYYSDKAGIISYNIDNLENIYVPDKISELYPKNLKKMNEEMLNQYSGKNVKTGDQIYKIIDNYEWYIAVKLTEQDIIDTLQEGKNLLVRLDGSTKEVKGEIFKVNREKDEAVLILRFNKGLYNYYQERYLDIDIILQEYEGLKIPTKAIVERDGIKGVYIKGKGGITRFRAINILGQDSEYTIVEEGKGVNKSLIEININGKNVNIDTLSIYDEVIVNGDKVQEGEIIN